MTSFTNPTPPRKIVCAALAGTLVLPLGALGQGTPAGPPPATSQAAPSANTPPATGTTGSAHPAGSNGRHTSQSPTERVESRITSLRAELAITPAQEAQWSAFAQVMRDNASHMERALEQRATGFGQMTAVDNLNSYAAIAAEHAQDMQRLAAAFQPLYTSFSEEQKKAADEVFRHRPPAHRAQRQTKN